MFHIVGGETTHERRMDLSDGVEIRDVSIYIYIFLLFSFAPSKDRGEKSGDEDSRASLSRACVRACRRSSG